MYVLESSHLYCIIVAPACLSFPTSDMIVHALDHLLTSLGIIFEAPRVRVSLHAHENWVVLFGSLYMMWSESGTLEGDQDLEVLCKAWQPAWRVTL